MAQGEGEQSTLAQRFGACCSELKEAMGGQDFEPLITQGDDGVLYVTVGLLHMEDEEPGIVDHPLYFCPFCGAKLQTPDQVMAKLGNEPVAND
jgi:hypothetical protein